MRRIRENPADFIVTSAILLLGIVGLVMALQFPERAGSWPRAIMVMLILGAGLYMAMFLLARPAAPDPAAEQAKANEPPFEWSRVLINIGLVTGLVLAAPVLGLFTSAALYLMAHMLFLGVRPLWLAALIAGGATLVLYAFFGGLLGVSIPGVLLI
jgi:hypothetical protein